MPQVSELLVYPVKSCRGIGLSSAETDRRGMAGDRRWMVVDEWGRFLSLRTVPRLALVQVRVDGDRLVLEAPGSSPLELPARAEGNLWPVSVWDSTGQARDAGAAASNWLSGHLGTGARLVQMEDDFARTTSPEYAPGFPLSFADGYPVLVIGEGSLSELNRRMRTPLPMHRFRPNVVVSGAAPFAEDRWKRIRVGQVELRLVKPCTRCVATTVDQSTTETGPEPLRTLATFRRWGGNVVFGQNAVVERGGRMRVGDAVEVLELGEPLSPPADAAG